jgi:phosphopantothenoylcysteine decarboxylase/phosphopantothenate--cysteine ligase
VRRLTNFSTGHLGTTLANHLAGQGFEVTLLRSETATAPLPVSPVRCLQFSTTADLAGQFLAHATDEPIAIFHAAAVSDFSFGPVYERQPDGHLEIIHGGKISTRSGALLVTLRPTPKILSNLREWFPKGLIVGWKYEVDGRRTEVLDRAQKQLAECFSDACIANGPAHGPGYSLVLPESVVELSDSARLLSALSALVATKAGS